MANSRKSRTVLARPSCKAGALCSKTSSQGHRCSLTAKLLHSDNVLHMSLKGHPTERFQTI